MAEEDSSDPILTLLTSICSADAAVVCPNLSESIIQQLQQQPEGDDDSTTTMTTTTTTCLLQLAHLFRDQSAILLKQAKLLDQLASGNNNKQEEGESSLALLHQNNVEHWAKRCHEIMVESQDRMDAIENGLENWDKSL